MSVEINSSEQPQAVKEQKSNQESTRLAEKFHVTIYDAWCKKCGICVEFCPKDVLTADALGNPHPTNEEKCIGCTQCVLHCPDFAITVSENNAEEVEKK